MKIAFPVALTIPIDILLLLIYVVIYNGTFIVGTVYHRIDTHPLILVNRTVLLEKKEYFMGSISSKVAIDDLLCGLLSDVDCFLIRGKEL